MANKKINQLVSKTSILSTDLFGIGDATTGQLFKKTIAELQAAIGGAVISVNGLVGTVVLNTDDIQELATPTNKYFTDARARGAISLTVTGNSGASTYSSGTGVLNVPTYTLAGLGGITASFLSGTSGISYNSTTGVITYSGTVYTDASIRALLSGSTGISYNSTTGAISYSGTVYTDSSVRALISLTTTGTSGASTYNNTTGVINVPEYTLAGLGGISLTSLSGGTGITYNNTTGAISYSGTVYTDASVRALISASGAVSYNNTTGVISLTSGNLTEATSSVLTITGGTGAVLGSGTSIQVKQATTSVSGFLSSTDWTTFNNKASALSGTTNYVAKFTSSTGIGNSSIQDNGSVVGINTSNLLTWFSGGYMNMQFGGMAGLFSNTSNTSITGALGLTYNLYADSAGNYQYMNTTSARAGSIINLDGGNISFSNAPAGTAANPTVTERMRITSAGDVAIGTTTADPYGFGYTSLSIRGGKYAGAGGHIHLITPTTDTNGQILGQINFIDGARANAIIRVSRATSTTTANMLFFTDAGSGLVERMRITSGGLVGIGTTTPTAKFCVSNGGAAGLEVNAQTSGVDMFTYNRSSGAYVYFSLDGSELRFNIAGAEKMRLLGSGNLAINTSADNGYKLYVAGTIYATGNITANSDLTLKKNLELITNPTDKLMQLNGYSYQWKEDDSHQYGVIAQEVEKILPYAVSTGNDGIKGVSYNQIIPVLIEAVKEQKAKIENLEILLASK